MATAEGGVRAGRASCSGARPGGAQCRAAGAVGPPPGRSGGGALRAGERTPAAVEKRGPYMVARAPSLQAKLQKHRELARAVLRRKGVLGAAAFRPDSSARRSVKFNKGYTALSQSPDENLVSLDSDSDGELGSRYSSGYSSAEASSAQHHRSAKCLFGACCVRGTAPASGLPSSPSRAGDPGSEPAAAAGRVSPG
ncbi:protein FAM219B isoform X3 [Oryctolagus cuniculus]|uniref:protein FAM219B isoform X3 n=1 Tax=Oryctolagus cuniculus TaxID=9986 RepID=UPI003879A70C